MKKCPYCAEEIQDEAIKCRYCGESISPPVMPAAPATHRIIRNTATNGGEWSVDQSTLNKWMQEKRLLPFDKVLNLATNQTLYARDLFPKNFQRTSPLALIGCGFFLVIFVIVGLVAIFSVPGPRQIRSPIPRNKASADSIKTPALEMHTPFRLGGFTYSIDKVATKKNIPGYLGHKAQQGALLLIVEYTIENNGNKSKTVMTDDFKVTDFKGREFSPSSDAGTAYALSGNDKDLILSEVQPGLKRKMASIFEIPEESIKGAGLKLIVPEKGWGSSQVVVDLTSVEK